MAMHKQVMLEDAVVPISGRPLTLPAGPIFHLQRAGQSDYEIGEFRAWAGYKNLGSDDATDGLAHFQHVVSFAGTEQAGRTGIHAHFAHAHIVIPTSGRGVFSYDGIVTEAVPGSVIVQHGGGDYSVYGSLARIDVRVGQQVVKGAVVGTVGATDPDLPPHLHFEVRPKGRAVDPLEWLRAQRK